MRVRPKPGRPMPMRWMYRGKKVKPLGLSEADTKKVADLLRKHRADIELVSLGDGRYEIRRKDGRRVRWNKKRLILGDAT